MPKPTDTAVCIECGWHGTDEDLVQPSHILDDDLPDCGGDCPRCGSNCIMDYEDEETDDEQNAETGGRISPDI